ncbi:MAG: hypothetical protein IT456_05025, partial [Planctomycetes bacterium]|nr:hypothetical protein [Planctomycetota bacterium]
MRTSSLLCLLGLAACSQITPKPPAVVLAAPAAKDLQPGFTNSQSYDEWRASRWADEFGNQPTSAQRIAARDTAHTIAEYAASIDDPNLQRTSWVPHGPDNIGGRTRGLVIHPTRPYRMWAGSCGGGVWRSDTYGSSWTRLDDRMGNLVIGCLALDPNNPDVLYAGTGEGFSGSSVLSTGVGIWKSSDGGTTWSVLSTTTAFGNVSRIAIPPNNSSIVLAATSTGVRRSTDAGATWTTVITGVTSQQVLFDPNNASRCIAHVRSTAAGNAATVRMSSDAGATWTTTTYANGSGRIELAYAKATANLVFAAVDVGGGQLWRSTDGGNFWAPMTATGMDGVGAQMAYNNCIWVDPTNSNHLVVGWTSIYRSTDGGASFTIISNGGGYVLDEDAPHTDTHTLVADPGYNGTTNKTLYCCNDGGIYRTSDITTVTTTSGWSRRKNFYPTTQFQGVAGHGSGRLIGGTQDNGSFAVTMTSDHAVRLSGGDGGYCVIDPVDPNLTYTTTQFRSIWRKNGAAVEQNISGGVGEEGPTACTGFNTPLEIDPNNRTRLYSGGCSLWRTDDATVAAPTWIAAKASTGSAITAIAIAPSNSSIVWVGHANGAVFRTANATAATPTWTTVDPGTGGVLPDRTVNAITIHRTTPNTVLVGLGSFVAGNLQRTADNGANWSVVTGSGPGTLPAAPVYAIAQHPILADRFYVGSDVGVFDTQDNCATWSTPNDGPADVACYDLDFIPGTTTLLLGTHGRGLWTAELSAPGARSLGAGCPGSNGTPALTATPPRLGQSMGITLSGAVNGRPVYLLQGLSKFSWFGNALPFDMAPFGAAGCKLLMSPDIVREMTLSASGPVTTSLPIGSSPALVGQQFFLQALVVDPAANTWGHTLSNAMHLTID